jgi:hypothetical protein
MQIFSIHKLASHADQRFDNYASPLRLKIHDGLETNLARESCEPNRRLGEYGDSRSSDFAPLVVISSFVS